MAQGGMISDVLATLEPFHPLVAGTFPIGIHTHTSDLDVLCEVHDFAQFESVVTAAFGHHQGYALRHLESNPRAVVVNFELHGTAVEVFGQDKPVYEQNGFRHLLIEGRLLRLGGNALRAWVVVLKRRGIKTEPAFAELLQLAGDPYEALLKLEAESDEALRALVDRALAASHVPTPVRPGAC